MIEHPVTTDLPLADSFQQRVELGGSRVFRTDRGGLPGLLAELTDGASSVSLTSEIRALLPELTMVEHSTVDWPEIAVARAMLGVAATGSSAMAPTVHNDRLLAMLSVRLILLLPSSAVVPTLTDAMSVLRGWIAAGQRRYVTMISGPSRTADIEQVLTVGMHGPRELTVILIDGWSPSDA